MLDLSALHSLVNELNESSDSVLNTKVGACALGRGRTWSFPGRGCQVDIGNVGWMDSRGDYLSSRQWITMTL